MNDETETTGVADAGMIATDPKPDATDLVVARAADEWLHPLEPYGPAKALREMTRRIMLFDTGKEKMNPTEAGHLAQVAASAWLNPFTGEIWAWVTVYQGKRKLSIMPGRKGLIRHAKEQAIAEGDKFYPEYEEVKALELRRSYNLEQGDLAYICKLRSIREIETWNQSLTAAGTAGLEPSAVQELVGPRPYTFGLGVLRAAEIANLDKRSDNRMTHTERAQKRAYMMALKQKYVLPLAHAIGEQGQTVEDFVIEAEWAEVDPPAGKLPPGDPTDPPTDPPADPPEPEADPDPPEPAAEEPTRPYQPDEVRRRYEEAIGRNAGTRKTEKIGDMELWQMVAWQLREVFAGTDDQEDQYHAVLYQVTGKRSSKDLTGAECRALLQWLDPQEREGAGAGLKASHLAVKEANALYQERLLDLGQMAMDMEIDAGKE